MQKISRVFKSSTITHITAGADPYFSDLLIRIFVIFQLLNREKRTMASSLETRPIISGALPLHLIKPFKISSSWNLQL